MKLKGLEKMPVSPHNRLKDRSTGSAVAHQARSAHHTTRQGTEDEVLRQGTRIDSERQLTE